MGTGQKKIQECYEDIAFRNAMMANFRPVRINPNDLEVDEEWWIQSLEFIEQEQKESLRQSVRGKGIPMCDPHFEEVKQTKTTEDSEKLEKILNMMEEIVTLKRKWSIVEDDPTRPLSDHEEEEAKEYRNENVDDFNVNFADTPGPPSFEIVDKPKRIKKPFSNVLSPYIVFKKKLRKKNDFLM
ncbi:hypothetical protein L1987_24660 [Smallanthus sonchifolius]|uniref:Uncharacterized protein n=1 Tax=Smallanthus sonchifolius TaxID=185202 RepID=A0ACB9IKU5_9ASTR|nr:hypothetical protein L1987_24660 [Smallanthus sonchifolius]